MKWFIWFMVGLLLLGTLGAVGYNYHWYEKLSGRQPASKFRTARVARGEIVENVNSTGTLQPVHTVQIGAIVSGPISKVLVDYNSKVKAGQLLAKIDPRNYEAQVQRDQAALATRKADLERVKALAANASANDKRAQGLRKLKATYISEAELDQSLADLRTSEAQVKLAEASIKEAEGSLKSSQSNLDYTNIYSPVDGIIMDRKVDEGQTVAASFQTPVLFLVAPHMDERMHVYASVDEADIGLIRKAQEEKQPVSFTVDAYPDALFNGHIFEVRLNPTTLQNVVTYTVVVETPNEQVKLLPGMTAKLSFQIQRHEGVLKVPNAALRFLPKPEQVQPEFRQLLEGISGPSTDAERNAAVASRSADEIAAANRQRNVRHVWKLNGELLAAIEVTTGLSDNDYTEVLSGDLSEKQELVTGNAVSGFGAR